MGSWGSSNLTMLELPFPPLEHKYIPLDGPILDMDSAHQDTTLRCTSRLATTPTCSGPIALVQPLIFARAVGFRVDWVDKCHQQPSHLPLSDSGQLHDSLKELLASSQDLANMTPRTYGGQIR